MFKCPLCREQVGMNHDKLAAHLKRKHPYYIKSQQLVDEYHAVRLILENRQFGTCTVCKKPTTYNPATRKFFRICAAPECRKHVADTCKANIMRVRKVPHLLNNPLHQMKMMAGRKNTKHYTFRTGSIQEYHSSNEHEFLMHLDLIHHWPGTDVVTTGPDLPVFEYTLQDRSEHLYYPDVFIRSMKLVVEIKNTEDENTGPRLQKLYSGVEKAKETAVLKEKMGFCFVENNDFTGFDELVRKARSF